MAAKKVLMVLTSHEQLGDTGEETGYWLEEFVAPFYIFIDAGIEVTLASPAGGLPPVDPKSTSADLQSAASRRFDSDLNVQIQLRNTQQLADIESGDYGGVFYSGGHGTLWDLPANGDSISLIKDFLSEKKPVATVCHATAALLNVYDESGESIIKNTNISGFSNSEEDALQLSEIVPFLLEDELKRRGGIYHKAADWQAFAIQDGLIISGQNPASSELVAHKLLEQLDIELLDDDAIFDIPAN